MLRDEPKLLTTLQVARRLGQTEETVRRKIRSGDLPALRLGSSDRSPFRVPETEFRTWLYGPQEIDDVGEAPSSHPHPARAPLASSAEVVDLRPPAGLPENAA
jgi:excisionase family DNA binding protein